MFKMLYTRNSVNGTYLVSILNLEDHYQYLVFFCYDKLKQLKYVSETSKVLKIDPMEDTDYDHQMPS